MSYVYILKSLKNESYYVGSTEDIERRFKQHNSGNVEATKYKRPYELVFRQDFKDNKTAKQVEFKIKSWKRRDFIEKIIKDGKIRFIEE